MEYDIQFFTIIQFDDKLEEKSIEIIKKHHMKALDSIQLASALLSKADKFITSDKRLYKISKKVLQYDTIFV